MREPDPDLSRRGLLTAAGGAVAAAILPPGRPRAQGLALALRLRAGTAVLRDNQPPSPVWDFETATTPLQFGQGSDLAVMLANDLPVGVALSLRGLGGVPVSEPLMSRPPLAPGQTATLDLSLKQAGTLLLDTRLLGDGQARALPVRSLSVLERQPPVVDRDLAFLIEDWRLAADGTAMSPGRDPGTAAGVFTVNGKPGLDLAVRRHERIRLRFINGCQRAVIAIKIDDHEVRVMAIDSQPAEPFLARNGQLVLAPGTRVDAFIDATGQASTTAAIQLHDGIAPRPIGRLVYSDAPPVRSAPLPPPDPLPSNGLAAKFDLQSALRVDLPLDIRSKGGASDWGTPAEISASRTPAFRVRRGRVAVLALANRAAEPIVFHLHGGPFRLLDRLDDGWKPFWLDTLILDAGQTQRIAFMANTAGAWLMEAAGTAWSAPRLTRWYAVD